MTPADFSTDLAVVIGIDDYTEAVGRLQTPVEDARAVAGLLARRTRPSIHGRQRVSGLSLLVSRAPPRHWVRHLEQDEARRLLRSLEGLDADLRILAEAALHTGCAYGELVGLRVEDYLREVGGIQVLYGKTHARRRVVYLGDEGLAFFDAQTAGKAHLARADLPP